MYIYTYICVYIHVDIYIHTYICMYIHMYKSCRRRFCNTLQHAATHSHTHIIWQISFWNTLGAPCDYSRYWYLVRCSVLQCVAVCCSVLQCVAVCCSVLQCGAVWCSVLQCVALCCSVLQCVALCCSVVQCAAVCCSVLQSPCQQTWLQTLKTGMHVEKYHAPVLLQN